MPGKAQSQQEILDDALAEIEKDFGKGTIMRMSDAAMDVAAITTGSLNIDIALGVGGIPLGRIIEIFGPESSGKSTIAMHIVAEFQKLGKKAVYVDAEHAMDPAYAKAVGVDIRELLISQPDTAEQCLGIVDRLSSKGAVDLIVVDSVAAMTPRAELEGEIGDSHVGLHARLMSQALRKIVGHVKKTNTTVIFINQLREKIGVMFGSPETTPGGRALKFYASIRLDARRIETVKTAGEASANRTRVKVVKNKVAPPFRQAEFDIEFGRGINRAGEVIDLGVQFGVLRKSGAWYYYGERGIGQGRPNSIILLEENELLFKELEDAVRAKAFGNQSIIDEVLGVEPDVDVDAD